MCEICKPGFILFSTVDESGATQYSCLADFCGIEGYGKLCSEPKEDEVQNCRRTIKADVSLSLSRDSCTSCKPGFFSFIYGLYRYTDPTQQVFADDGVTLVSKEINGVLVNCRAQENTLTKDFFVRPELQSFFVGDAN